MTNDKIPENTDVYFVRCAHETRQLLFIIVETKQLFVVLVPTNFVTISISGFPRKQLFLGSPIFCAQLYNSFYKGQKNQL